MVPAIRTAMRTTAIIRTTCKWANGLFLSKIYVDVSIVYR